MSTRYTTEWQEPPLTKRLAELSVGESVLTNSKASAVSATAKYLRESVNPEMVLATQTVLVTQDFYKRENHPETTRATLVTRTQ